MERDYTNDFYPGVAHTVLGGGQALDIAYDTLGGIWLLNEYSNNIEHVTPSGHVESLTVPLARDPLSTPFPFAAVNPFAWEVGKQNTAPVAISSLAERATSIGPKMWFTQGGGMPGFGGFPWSLRVDEGAVYLGEYATQHILRFDKASSVFSEIHIPCSTSQVKLHSIDIDSRTDRLWFTLSNEVQVPLDKTASTIGYIDLTSWRDHIADPVRTKSISAVLYRGLDSIPASKNWPDKHQAFRGIAIDPASGKIAIATMWREQITELTPNPGFWP
jgi:hypothetical protein